MEGWCIVTEVRMTTDGWYRYHVEGFYRDEPDREFSWSVPSLTWEGYNWSLFDLVGFFSVK